MNMTSDVWRHATKNSDSSVMTEQENFNQLQWNDNATSELRVIFEVCVLSRCEFMLSDSSDIDMNKSSEKSELESQFDDFPSRLLTSQVRLFPNSLSSVIWYFLFWLKWQRSERCIVYVIYRWLIAIFYTFSFVNSVMYSISIEQFRFMFIYLTRWNLFGTMMVTLVGAVLVTRYQLLTREVSDRVKKVLKLFHIMSNVCVVLACVVSTVYWTKLYDGRTIILNNILCHSTNSAILLIDLMVIQHPHSMWHFVYPVTGGFMYVTFSVVYTFLGGVNHEGENYVYPILDWKNQLTTSLIISFVTMTLTTFFHVMIGVIHRLRFAIHQCVTKDQQTLPHEMAWGRSREKSLKLDRKKNVFASKTNLKCMRTWIENCTESTWIESK